MKLYHRMDAGNHTIKHENKEGLIVLMPDTIVYPDTVVILQASIGHNKTSKRFETTEEKVKMHTILKTHLLQVRQ